MSNQTIYHLILLDESGSMQAIRQSTIDSFNELLQSVRQEAARDTELLHRVQFYSFNSGGLREQVALTPAAAIPDLSPKRYQPEGMTPLYDAIGHTVSRLRFTLEDEDNYAVLVTIFTDGAENDSREYTGRTIANMIRKLETRGWTFTYIGTNHDVEAEAGKLSIKQAFSFSYSHDGVYEALAADKKRREAYYDEVKKGGKKSRNTDPGQHGRTDARTAT